MFKFIEWSPLIMLVLGALGFLIAIKKSKRVKIVSVVTGVLLPVIAILLVIDFFVVTRIASDNFEHNFFLFTERFDISLHNNYQWTRFEEGGDEVIYKKVGRVGEDFGSIPNDDALWNIVEIQEQGDWLAGSVSNNLSQDEKPNGWFLLNTRTDQEIDAKSEEELRVAAAEKGIQLHLQSCHEFYLSRCFSWIVCLEIILLLVLPIIGLGLLWKLALKFVAKDKTIKRAVVEPA